MKDVGLPEFGTPDEFINLSDVFKMHAEQDSLWTEECTKITDARPGQVQQFAEHPIRARTMLQQLNSSLVKYRAHAVDIRGVYVAPMEQHRFPWAKLVKNYLSVGLNMKEVTLFKKYLGWTVKETVG
jgi:hypothetical protein